MLEDRELKEDLCSNYRTVFKWYSWNAVERLKKNIGDWLQLYVFKILWNCTGCGHSTCDNLPMRIMI